MTLRSLALALVLPCLLAPACTDDPVVLATLPDRPGGPGPRRCGSSTDCPSGFYCDKRGCDEPGGECQPFPKLCPGDEAPVCGCDGVTYFNDCLRRASGVAGATAGECTQTATTCGGLADTPCPEGAFCAKLLGFARDPRACEPAAGGTCWVLPATCPPATSLDRWEGCGPPSPDFHCLDTCTAIATELPFFRASRCP